RSSSTSSAERGRMTSFPIWYSTAECEAATKLKKAERRLKKTEKMLKKAAKREKHSRIVPSPTFLAKAATVREPDAADLQRRLDTISKTLGTTLAQNPPRRERPERPAQTTPPHRRKPWEMTEQDYLAKAAKTTDKALAAGCRQLAQDAAQKGRK